MPYRKAILAGLALFGLAGCKQDLADQPRYSSLQPSAFFADGRSARPLVPGTVARGDLRDDEALYTGKVKGVLVTTMPFAVTRRDLERGRERFTIYCTPCHDQTGGGNGMIVQRGYRHPPSYHIDRLRQAPVGHFFDVITRGFGAMIDYSDRITVRDRWLIVAYIRALQLSQHATVADVPAKDRDKLEAKPEAKQESKP